MELRQLRTFVAVADEGGFGRAGLRLHVVQSAVSATIRNLERDLGTRLFVRDAHRVELTDAGRVLLGPARATLAAAEAARDAIDELHGGLRGTVRVGFMQTQRIPEVSAARMLARMRAEHPLVDVQLASGTSESHLEAIRAGRQDVAYVALPPLLAADVRLDVLHERELDLLVPQRHPLAERPAVALGDLVDEPFVDGPPGWGSRMLVDGAFVAAGARRVVRYEVADPSAMLDFVHHGQALAVLPATLAERDDAIVAVPIRPAPPRLTFSLATAQDRAPSAATRAVLALAREVAREPPGAVQSDVHRVARA